MNVSMNEIKIIQNSGVEEEALVVEAEAAAVLTETVETIEDVIVMTGMITEEITEIIFTDNARNHDTNTIVTEQTQDNHHNNNNKAILVIITIVIIAVVVVVEEEDTVLVFHIILITHIPTLTLTLTLIHTHILIAIVHIIHIIVITLTIVITIAILTQD